MKPVSVWLCFPRQQIYRNEGLIPRAAERNSKERGPHFAVQNALKCFPIRASTVIFHAITFNIPNSHTIIRTSTHLPHSVLLPTYMHHENVIPLRPEFPIMPHFAPATVQPNVTDSAKLLPAFRAKMVAALNVSPAPIVSTTTSGGKAGEVTVSGTSFLLAAAP